jgi:hypothetical protein
MKSLRSYRFFVCGAMLCGALALSSQAHTSYQLFPGLPISTAAPSQAESPVFKVPEAGMLIKGNMESQQTMRSFLHEFGSITGETFLYGQDTAKQLECVTTGINRDIRVDAESMYSVMQDLLVQNGFYLVDVRRQKPRLLRVVARQVSEGNVMRRWAKFVPDSDLGRYADNSALFITTTLRVTNLDSGRLANGARSLIVDSNLERMFSIQSSGQIVLCGPANQVVEWASLLKEMNRISSPAVPTSPEEAK